MHDQQSAIVINNAICVFTEYIKLIEMQNEYTKRLVHEKAK